MVQNGFRLNLGYLSPVGTLLLVKSREASANFPRLGASGGQVSMGFDEMLFALQQ